jgi:hypothetical protein
MTDKKQDDVVNPGYDWHAYQDAPEEDAEGNKVEGIKGCYVCGEDEDAEVHQVDDDGNPTGGQTLP